MRFLRILSLSLTLLISCASPQLAQAAQLDSPCLVKRLQHEVGKVEPYRQKEVLGFSQINPWLAHWNVIRPENEDILRINTSTESVTLRGSLVPNQDAPEFLMKLPSPFRPETYPNLGTLGNLGQDEGKGLRMQLETQQPEVHLEVTLSGHTNVVNTPFQAVTQITLPQGQHKITIPWSDFRLKEKATAGWRYGFSDDVKKQIFPTNSAFYPTAFPIETVGFRVLRPVRSSSERIPFEFTLDGPIYRDFDLQWLSKASPEFISANYMENVFKQPGPEAFISFLCNKLQSAEAQDYAFSVIEKGDAAIAEELQKYAFKMKVFTGKVSPDQFFESFTKTVQPTPIESGSFALYHGRYTHAGQILAVLYHASADERRQFKGFYAMFETPRWRNLWNVFFDAPGADGPNAPRWWVQEFKKRKIAAEPSSFAE